MGGAAEPGSYIGVCFHIFTYTCYMLHGLDKHPGMKKKPGSSVGIRGTALPTLAAALGAIAPLENEVQDCRSWFQGYHLSTCLHVRLSAYLSVYRSLCLFIDLFMYRSAELSMSVST